MCLGEKRWSYQPDPCTHKYSLHSPYAFITETKAFLQYITCGYSSGAEIVATRRKMQYSCRRLAQGHKTRHVNMSCQYASVCNCARLMRKIMASVCCDTCTNVSLKTFPPTRICPGVIYDDCYKSFHKKICGGMSL